VKVGAGPDASPLAANAADATTIAAMAQRLSPFIVELRRFIAELCADLELVIDLSFRSVENG
jgi:hypothetical protein